MTDEKVSVTFPNGTATQIDNPLYDYNFHPLDNKEINGTVRVHIVSSFANILTLGRAVHYSQVPGALLVVYPQSAKIINKQSAQEKRRAIILS